jgi:hypothetical protein
MASHLPFGHPQPKLWAKEGPGVKLAVWLPTTKSRESTSSRHSIWECDTSLERSRRGLVQTSSRSDSAVGSYELPKSRDSFGTISGQFWDSNLGVPRVSGKSDIRVWVLQRVTEYTIGSKVVAYSQVRAVVSCGSKCPWLVPTPKGVPECELTTWVVCFDANSSLIY